MNLQQLFDGQPCELARIEPYTRRDGTASTLSARRSHCVSCGVPFELRTPTAAASFQAGRVNGLALPKAELAWRTPEG